MIRNIGLSALLVLLSACVSTQKGAEYETGKVHDLPGHGVILMYRDDRFRGSAIIWTVTDGAKDIVVMAPGVYYPFYVKPGHIELFAVPYMKFTDYVPGVSTFDVAMSATGEAHRRFRNANAQPRKAISIDVEAGKTYYLEWKSKFASKYPVVTRVDASIGNAALKGRRLPQ